MMEKITRGQLRVLDVDGTMYTFGTPPIYSTTHPDPHRVPSNHNSDNQTNGTNTTASANGLKARKEEGKVEEIRAEIRVTKDAFWIRMLLLSDLGFAEAWMGGDIEVDDLDALFKVSPSFDHSHSIE